MFADFASSKSTANSVATVSVVAPAETHHTLSRIFKLKLDDREGATKGLYLPLDFLAMLKKTTSSGTVPLYLSMANIEVCVLERLRYPRDSTAVSNNGMTYLADCYMRTLERAHDPLHQQVANLIIGLCIFLIEHSDMFLSPYVPAWPCCLRIVCSIWRPSFSDVCSSVCVCVRLCVCVCVYMCEFICV
jgi:hypothetical protein